MLPQKHIILGLLFSLFLYCAFPCLALWKIIVIFLASVLIDIDHYSVYVYRYRDLSIVNSYKWFFKLKEKYKNKRVISPISVLHTIEFLVFLGILGYFNEIALLIFIGFVFHSFCDIILMAIKRKLYAREFSLIRYAFRHKNKEYI